MFDNNLVHDLPVLWRNCWLVPMHIHKLPFKQVEKTSLSSLGATFLRKKTHTWSQSINQILCHRTHFYLSQLKDRMLVCKRSLKLLVSEYLFWVLMIWASSQFQTSWNAACMSAATPYHIITRRRPDLWFWLKHNYILHPVVAAVVRHQQLCQIASLCKYLSPGPAVPSRAVYGTSQPFTVVSRVVLFQR